MRLCWQQIPSTIVSELLCHTGLDGVVLDTEHAAFGNETLFSCIQIITSLDKTCFVRLMEPTKQNIRMCLDAGATGLIFSTVEDLDQCRNIMDYSKFPKFGGRRGLGLVRENLWGGKELVTGPPILIAQIETMTGVNNIEDIASFGFDYYMIGPYDLSASLGYPGNFECSEYKSAVSKIQENISVNKMAVHIPTNIKNEIKKYNNYGILAVGMDTIGLLEFYKEIL